MSIDTCCILLDIQDKYSFLPMPLSWQNGNFAACYYQEIHGYVNLIV
jgi:hypothetical protein